MTKQIIGGQAQARNLVVGKKQTIQIQKGQHLRVQDWAGEVAKDAGEVVAIRKGKMLKLKFADGTELEFENFYEVCSDDACSVSVAGKDGARYTIGGETPVGAAAADGAQLVYAYGEQTSLMAMAGADGMLASVLGELGAGVVSYVPTVAEAASGAALSGGSMFAVASNAMSMTGLGIAAVAAGIAGGVAAASGGGSSARSGAGGGTGGGSGGGSTTGTLLGSFVAGPVVVGHGLVAKAYGEAGQELATGALSNDGTFALNLGNYTGAVMVVVTDTTLGADYWDEATGAPKDLSVTMLRAATFAPAGGTIHVNVNVFTEVAVRERRNRQYSSAARCQCRRHCGGQQEDLRCIRPARRHRDRRGAGRRGHQQRYRQFKRQHLRQAAGRCLGCG